MSRPADPGDPSDPGEQAPRFPPFFPALGVCGWGGSGKTTLIERVLPRLRALGLAVAVIKHDAHGIAPESPGKDSARLYAAGADVLLRGPGESRCYIHGADSSGAGSSGAGVAVGGSYTGCRGASGSGFHADELRDVADLLPRCDLALVEGYKRSSLPKVWLLAPGETGEAGETATPPGLEQVALTLAADRERDSRFLAFVHEWLAAEWSRRPVMGCVLIGGGSRRMSAPKHLLRREGRSWLAWTLDALARFASPLVVAGAGELPRNEAGLPTHVRVPDVIGAAGPAAGLLAAMRWAPEHTCLLAAVDHPSLSPRAVEWLLSQRCPGRWAILPRTPEDGRVQPLLALYDPRLRSELERSVAAGERSLSALAQHPKVFCPEVPTDLAEAWRDVDRPDELAAADR